jgi:hypothetical protein
MIAHIMVGHMSVLIAAVYMFDHEDITEVCMFVRMEELMCRLLL